jgi:hypothetical protein
MQVESLKVFCDLTETESFTKAAHINGVTQSAVSQQVSSLERQFKSLLMICHPDHVLAKKKMVRVAQIAKAKKNKVVSPAMRQFVRLLKEPL